MAKRITWWQAAEAIGVSDRQMRRRQRRYEKFGCDGLWVLPSELMSIEPTLVLSSDSAPLRVHQGRATRHFLIPNEQQVIQGRVLFFCPLANPGGSHGRKIRCPRTF
jgi:hypothetical protein